ncbi:MAG: hypothetical protein IKO26_05635 [Paludibacteraceae bacterium]|nr:hypothetical protein [Paludibacteraceae bacterium]
MKRFFSTLFVCAAMCGVMMAQPSQSRPQRTPEEEALKQTTRLIRELGIKDSVRIDTIYRMHLKYARFRQQGLTRVQNMERMQAIYNELQQLLTPEEFEQFMNHPAEQPRHPRNAGVVAPNAELQHKQAEQRQRQ